MAVWTSPTSKPDHQDYRQLHDALVQQEVVEWIRQRPTVVLGDFNTNESYKSGGWHDLKALLDSFRLASAYHEYSKGEKFGEERLPTHFHRKNENSKFHLDYCFLPEAWSPNITKVEIGTYSVWSKDSDHVPLIVDLDF